MLIPHTNQERCRPNLGWFEVLEPGTYTLIDVPVVDLNRVTRLTKMARVTGYLKAETYAVSSFPPCSSIMITPQSLPGQQTPSIPSKLSTPISFITSTLTTRRSRSAGCSGCVPLYPSLCNTEFLELGSTDCALRVPCSLDGASDCVIPQIQLLVRACHCLLSLSGSACLTHSFIPIVVLALVFNMINVVGFTYASVPPLIPHRAAANIPTLALAM